MTALTRTEDVVCEKIGVDYVVSVYFKSVSDTHRQPFPSCPKGMMPE